MAARPCTYTFTDNDGNELTLGLDDFKAYLASGGLEQLLPSTQPFFSRPETKPKQPWELTREEYETPAALKDQKSFYLNVGGKDKIEVIRNPASADLNALKKEALQKYGPPAHGDPALRFTKDREGNSYYWIAAEGVHAFVEPALTRLEGVEVNQNADQKLSHRSVIRRALYEGKPVPNSVLAEYPGMVDEVSEIPGNKVTAAFSRPAKGFDILKVLNEFAKDDEIFKHPVSTKQTIEGVMADITSEFKYAPYLNDTYGDGLENKVRVFTTEDGSHILIKENDGKVWIDVSALTPGASGGEVYAAVGNYAHNAGLKFIDDPAGVSEFAVVRRPMHMLSLALRFGTTDFLDVSENFEKSSRLYGLTPLEWNQSNKDEKLLRLILRNVFPVYEALPELNNVRYDFRTNTFRSNVDGRDLRPVWAKVLADEGVTTQYGVRLGESTIRRAVFLKSLASTTSEEKSRLLEELGSDGKLAKRVSLEKMFSRTEAAVPKEQQVSRAEAIEHLKANFGVGIVNLINNGTLNFTQGKANWPKAARDAARGDEEAVYVNSKVYIDLTSTPQSRLNSVVIHELGEHFGLRTMLGEAGYRSLQQQIANRAKIQGSRAARAWQEVKDNYEFLEEGSEPFIAEVIAKLGEYNPKAPWYRRLLSQIKSFLMKMGLARGIVAGTITETDLHDLLITSLRKSASEAGREGMRLYGGALQAAYSVPAWHGSPHDFDRFSVSNIGGGEGAQAYGYGMYFAGSKDVAEYYRNKLSGRVFNTSEGTVKLGDLPEKLISKIGKFPPSLVDHILATAQRIELKLIEEGKTASEIADELEKSRYADTYYGLPKALRELEPTLGTKGKLYQVELAPEEDEFLLWDKPLSEQSEKVQSILKGITDSYINATKGKGEDVYTRIKGKVGTPQAASDYLHSLGIRGIKYLDGSSRGKGEGNFNYVVFKDEDVSITAKFSRPAQAQVAESKKEMFTALRDHYGSDKMAGQVVGWLNSNAGKTLNTLKQGGYALLSVRQLVERMKYAMPKLQEYVEHMQNRGAEATKWRLMADRLATKWKDLKDIKQANEVIQASTMQDIDASLDWTGVKLEEDTDIESDTFGSKLYVAYTQEQLTKGRKDRLASEALKAIQSTVKAMRKAQIAAGAKLSEDVTDDPSLYIRKNGYAFPTEEAAKQFVRTIEKMVTEQRNDRSSKGVQDENVTRQYGERRPGGMRGHQKLHEDYLKLSDGAKEVYAEANKLHDKMFNERLNVLIGDIQEAVENKRVVAQMIKEIRLKFELSSLNWYYAPLSRFGNSWFYGTDQYGNRVFSTFNTPSERDKAVEEFIAAGGVGINGYPIAMGEHLDGIDQNGAPAVGDDFIAKVITRINEAGLPKEQRDLLADNIYQMYLETLPDVSVRQNNMHRKNTLGFEKDALKNFSDAMHHGATQIANLKHCRKMRKVWEQHKAAYDLSTSPHLAAEVEARLEAETRMSANWDDYTQEYLDELVADPDRAEDENWTPEVLREAIKLRRTFEGEDSEMAETAIAKRAEDSAKILELRETMLQKDSVRNKNALEELRKAYEFTMAYQSGDMDKVATFLNKLNFMFSLGFSVSSGVVNLLQVPIVSMPVAAGRYGEANTTREFLKAYGEFGAAVKRWKKDEDGNISITEILKEKLEAARKRKDLAKVTELEDELAAMNYFKHADDISRTRTFDLMGIAEEGYTYGGKFNDFSNMAGFMFHHAERFNREVALLASYRLAKQAIAKGELAGSVPMYENTTVPIEFSPAENTAEGQKAFEKRRDAHLKAVALARELNYLSNGDYASENAARVFRGWFPKIALQFKKYSQMMYYMWGKSLADSIGKAPVREDFPEGATGDTLFADAKADREIARKTLKNIMLAQVVFGGAMSVPAMGAFQVVYEAIASAFGKPDEPDDLEKDLRMALYPLIGGTATEMIVKGVINGTTPINLASRIDLKDAFFREPMTEVEGRGAATEYLTQIFGPSGGLFQKMMQAQFMLREGHYDRAVEMVTPKFVGDIFKAGRFGMEGVTTLDDMPMRETSVFEEFAQGLGFSSSSTDRAYAERDYAKNHEKAINDTRSKLLRSAAKAKLKGEQPDMFAIREWNLRHPESPIRMENINASMKGIEESIAIREEHGYKLGKNVEFLYDVYDLED